MEGTSPICKSLVCCTSKDKVDLDGKHARKYGEYTCDLPIAAAQA